MYPRGEPGWSQAGGLALSITLQSMLTGGDGEGD